MCRGTEYVGLATIEKSKAYQFTRSRVSRPGSEIGWTCRVCDANSLDSHASRSWHAVPLPRKAACGHDRSIDEAASIVDNMPWFNARASGRP